MSNWVKSFVIGGLLAGSAMAPAVAAAIEDSDLEKRLAREINTNRAKNVILFVGDGMGVDSVTAGRILEGQLRGESGEENYLSFEQLPWSSLVKTYNYDAQVPDSAGTASAMNTGVKSRIGTFGLSPQQPNGKCRGSKRNEVRTIAEYAEAIGMSTGIVSTAAITHATPGAVYGHIAARGWESDTDLPDEAKENGCKDIARQLIEFEYGDGIDVALGGGRAQFKPKGKGAGRRSDGRDLVAEWRQGGGAFVGNRDDLLKHKTSSKKPLLGLFTSSHIDFAADRRPTTPTLAEMTEVAIRKLQNNDKGYYLMVEAGRIDHAHHANNAYRALHDLVALSEAVRKAKELTGEDTLILVTADHSHVFTMAGYPVRGNPIFGLVKDHEGKEMLAEDGKPYTTLGYQNGRSAVAGKDRADLDDKTVMAKDYLQEAAIPTMGETHGGEDVPIYASGPWAHLVSGTMDQTMIFHIIDHALGLRERAGAE